MPDRYDMLDVRAVAELLGVQMTTIHQWRWRRVMPEPDLMISNRPGWERSTIERWARATGRWPEPPPGAAAM